MKKKQTHFLGIGGIGMSALAHVLLEKGALVSGEDQNHSCIVETLQKKGAMIGNAWDAETQVVASSAIPVDHPSLQKAKQFNCPLYHRSQFLGKLMEQKKALLVTGTHGKTSTAALLAWVFISAELDPSYAIGGILKNSQKNGGAGNGEMFVAEADESDGSFLNYSGEAAILTNLEKEHLDFWKTEEKLLDGFRIFAKRTKTLFWCIDDRLLVSLQLKGSSYGFSEKADWRLLDVRQEGMKLFFSISYQDQFFEKIELPLIGIHQALNALAVWGLAFNLGVSEQKIRAAFSTFQGVERRLEKKGEAGGVTVYDDYAHHPTEIDIVLTALKKMVKNRRLIAIFQPHRFTRTRDCFEGFSQAFHAADQVYITDIFSAGEKPIKGITAQRLVESIPGSIFLKKLPTFKEGDVMITIGAGNIHHLGSQILENLS